MIYRIATTNDIKQIQEVRHSVNENKLSDPSRVTDGDCEDYIVRRGRGWVCEANDRIIGFAIADLQDNNIWALFIRPEHEGNGIGRKLHQIMMDWYFSETNETAWLSTSPCTRAEIFYRKAGWEEKGKHGMNELRFEMTKSGWQKIQQRQSAVHH